MTAAGQLLPVLHAIGCDKVKRMFHSFSHPEHREGDVDESRRRDYQNYGSGYLHHRFPEPLAQLYVRRAGLDLWKRDILVGITVTYGR